MLATTPSEVVELQTDLVGRAAGAQLRTHIAGVVASQLHATGAGTTAGLMDATFSDTSWNSAYSIVDRLHLAAQMAHLYTVTPDMKSLVDHAARGLDETDKHDMSLPPTQVGLVRFDSPIEFREVRGRLQKIHWVLWCPGQVKMGHTVKTVLMIHMFNDLEEPDEVMMQVAKMDAGDGLANLREAVGRWSYISLGWLTPGESIGSYETPLSLEQRDSVQREDPDSAVQDSQMNVNRFMHALFLMLNQSITSAREISSDRLSTKRARRMSLPGKVTVIDLRRMEGMSRQPGETSVEWQHRWVTRGHWRWQNYGSGPNKHAERIWIAPYVKGNPNGPLIISEKVYALRR